MRMGVSRVAITRRITRFKKTLLAASARAEALAFPTVKDDFPASGVRAPRTAALRADTALAETDMRLRAA